MQTCPATDWYYDCSCYLIMICTLVFLTAASTLLIQVLVKSLFDRGFLFLLSSAQMVESKGAKKLLLSSHNSLLCQLNTYLFPSVRVQRLKKKLPFCFLERRGRVEKNLQALFIFQESRMVVKYCKCYSLSIHLFFRLVLSSSICTKLLTGTFY